MNTKDLFIFKDLTQEQIDFYNDQGYLNVGKTLTPAGLEQLLAQAMDCWNAEKRAFDPNNTWLQNSLLVDIHKRSALIREFYFRGPVVDKMFQLIGPNIKGVTSQLTFKMRGNTKSFGWHQDNGYGELDPYNTITVLTALEDVDEGNGCLRIIPESHKQGQVDVSHIINTQTKAQQISIDLEVDKSKAMPVEMKAGETLIFHCWMLHQSRGNFSENRDRRILFLRYADADAVEVYNERRPRLGKLLKGTSQFPEVVEYEASL